TTGSSASDFAGSACRPPWPTFSPRVDRAGTAARVPPRQAMPREARTGREARRTEVHGCTITGEKDDGSVAGHDETSNVAGDHHLPCGTGGQPRPVGADREAGGRATFWTRAHPGGGLRRVPLRCRDRRWLVPDCVAARSRSRGGGPHRCAWRARGRLDG